MKKIALTTLSMAVIFSTAGCKDIFKYSEYKEFYSEGKETIAELEQKLIEKDERITQLEERLAHAGEKENSDVEERRNNLRSLFTRDN